MRPHALAVMTGLVVALAGTLPASRAEAQSEPARPAVHQQESKPIGRVVSATGSVTIEHATAVVMQAAASSQTTVGDLVYLGDIVQTGRDSRVGINFTDGTSFNLSSNARITLDEFLYEPNGNANSTLFSLSKGTMTLVAGKIARTGDMKVDTPVATMGIRGTTPHVEIANDGSVKFSTLIEEGKGSRLKKSAAPAVRPSDRPGEPGFNPKICRGC